MRTLSRTLLCVTLGAAPLAVLAETPTAAGAHGPTPTMGQLLEASGFSIGGYLDASYDYLDGDGVFTSGVANRVFESEPTGFNLHQAALIISKLPAEGVGGFVNITAGDDADIIAASGTGGAQYAGDDNFDVTQAYLQYAMGKVTVMAGKFVTMSGAEVINSTANANASRGILFGYAIPFGHTGVRTSFKLSDSLTLVAGVNNGWDQQSDLNTQKTAELCALFASKAFSLGAVAYVGQEPTATAGVSDDRTLVDVVASFNLTDAVTVVLNGDWGEQKNVDGLGAGNDATWSGVAGYLNVKFSDALAGSLRVEQFDDADGFRTGVEQKWSEVTATLNFAIADNLNVLPEIRFDSSDEDTFVNGTDVEDSQLGGMVKAIYKF